MQKSTRASWSVLATVMLWTTVACAGQVVFGTWDVSPVELASFDQPSANATTLGTELTEALERLDALPDVRVYGPRELLRAPLSVLDADDMLTRWLVLWSPEGADRVYWIAVSLNATHEASSMALQDLPVPHVTVRAGADYPNTLDYWQARARLVADAVLPRALHGADHRMLTGLGSSLAERIRHIPVPQTYERRLR